MTTEEAKQVVEILVKADGGCQVCVSHLLREFALDFDYTYADVARWAADSSPRDFTANELLVHLED